MNQPRTEAAALEELILDPAAMAESPQLLLFAQNSFS